MLSGTDGIAPGLGQFQQIHPLITAGGAVLVQPVPQQRQQTAAQHTVSPHDDSVGVVLTYQRQKVLHSRRQPGSIGRGKTAIIGQVLLKAAAGLRVHPGRIVEGVPVVGAQVENDRIGGPGGKIVGLLRPQRGVALPPAARPHTWV